MEIRDIPVKGYGHLQLLVDEKVALIDAAMGFNAAEIIAQIEEQTGGRDLDFILLTHSHFDHVGSVSMLRERYPDVKVIASEKTASVFGRPGAKALMKKLSDDMCRVLLQRDCTEFVETGLYVDRVVGERDTVELGQTTLEVIPAKGHTDCCIAFYDREDKVLFATETIGSWMGHFPLELELCKSYYDTLDTIRRFRSLEVEDLYLSHGGLMKDFPASEYFILAKAFAVNYKDLVLTAIKEGKSDEEVALVCKRELFDTMNVTGALVESVDRWMLNTTAFISAIHREFGV